MSKMLKKVYAAKRNINYDGGSKKSGTGAGIGRSGGLSRLVASQSSNNNNRLSLGITPVLTYRSNNVFTVNTTINVNDEIKPTLTGVTGTITYTISAALPADMNFNTNTGTITGTPRTSQNAITYTVTATNSDGINIISNAFTIRINDVAPAFTYSSSSIGTVDSLFTEIGPSPATSGTGIITYAISAALPTGMNFNINTGKITGTPATSQGSTSYTVTATNTGATFTCVPFTIRVNDVAPSFTYSSSSIGTVDSLFTEIGPSPATSGTGIITYSISAALPSGMNFSTATGKITGTPATSQGSTSYTVTATNTGATFTCLPFTIRINDVAPSFTYSSPYIGAVDSVFTLIPTVTTGTGTITYTISGALPSGLEFDPTTGRITGTPTTIQAATEYTVTASNTGNSSVTSLPFNIEIKGYIHFVAVGNGGSIMTSSNGTTDWVIRQSPTSNNWRSVTYGNDIFVAVAESGGTGNRVMTSTNGINWASQTTPALGDIEWRSVAYGNGIFVAVASFASLALSQIGSKCLMTSTNGSDWTLRDTLPSGISFTSVTFGNGRFVAIIRTFSEQANTPNGAITSTDGINWTQGNLKKNFYRSVTYGDGHFVAVTNLNTFATSPDGINWTNEANMGNIFYSVIGYGNGVFVALGTSYDLHPLIQTIANRSTDRITWNIIDIPSTVIFTSVTYGNGRFVAVGPDGTDKRVITSTDGLTWTLSSSADDTKAWNSVTYRP